MRLSVIIPCFRAQDYIGEQLEALAAQDWDEDWEIILSDNGLNEGLDTIVNRFAGRLPKTRILDAKAKRGASYARNCGAMHATGRDIVFVDADDVVGTGWLRNIGRALENHPFVASRLDFARLNPPEIRRTRGMDQDRTLMDFSVVRFLPFAITSGLGIRKVLHEAIGGFNERMKAVEDVEYCWRVQLHECSLIFEPDAVIHYRYRESLRKSFAQARLYGEFDVFLYKQYRNIIPLRPSRKKELMVWWKLIKRAFHLNTQEDREIWLRSVGKKLGRAKGSIKYRIFVP